MTSRDTGGRSLAVVYLARGADAGAEARFRRFLASYRAHTAGIEHELFVVLKGFSDPGGLARARGILQPVTRAFIETDDENFDIGAYAAAAAAVPFDDLCFLNSNTEVAGRDWLAKLAAAHRQPGMGLVCATGSYETMWPIFINFPKFPNVHARSNAFVMRRERAVQLLPARVPDKRAAFAFESGPDSLTRRLFHMGLAVEVVGRDGRSYSPQWWPASRTFRQADQRNLLVHDNQTRIYEALPWPDKRIMHEKTWGSYVQQGQPYVAPGSG